MTTVRERQRQVREEAILEVAYQMLAEQGYDNMSMDDLANQVGIAKATLYQHFPSKEDVAVHVVMRLMQMGQQDLLSAEPSLPAIIRLEQGLRLSLTRRIKLWGSRIILQPFKVTHHADFQAMIARMSEKLTGLIEAGKTEGSINTELSTPVLVHAILSLFRLDYDDLCKRQKIDADQIVNTFVTLVINGMKPPAMTH